MTPSIDDYRHLARTVAAALPIPGLRSVYLIGSLARGGFAPGTSDVDLLVFAAGASTRVTEFSLRETPFSVCIRPIEHLTDPFGPLRSTGQSEERSLKELTAVSDLMFLHDHGRLLHGEDIRSLATLPDRAEYLAYLRWESEVAARGPLRPGIADDPRHIAKRVRTLIRDMLFLHQGRISSRPADLLELVRPLLARDMVRAVAAALWLGGLPSGAARAGSSLRTRAAVHRILSCRDDLFAACAEVEAGPGRLPGGWVQLADLIPRTFAVGGDPRLDLSRAHVG